MDMESIFLRLHVRLVRVTTQYTTRQIRFWCRQVLAGVAVSLGVVLVLAHVAFVVRSPNRVPAGQRCLVAQLERRLPDAGILLVQVIDGDASRAYEFARDEGLLAVSQHTRERLGVAVASVAVQVAAGASASPSPACLDSEHVGWILPIVLRSLLGYDTVVLNALLGAYGGEGFVRVQDGGVSYTLSHATDVTSLRDSAADIALFKLGTLCTSVFLLFSTSELIALVLRQTQQRMLAFTLALRQHLRRRMGVGPLVASHLFESLVFIPIMLGAMFFHFEFFNDQLLAFLVLLAGWVGELFVICAARTAVSIRLFPRVHFAALLLVHVYFLLFPLGFCYLALIIASCVSMYCMAWLWDEHELPALWSRHISAQRPRDASAAGTPIHPRITLMRGLGQPTSAYANTHGQPGQLVEPRTWPAPGSVVPGIGLGAGAVRNVLRNAAFQAQREHVT